MFRFAPVLLLIALAGCPTGTAENASLGDDGNVPQDPSSAPCGSDLDCELASHKCCDCPTFATSASDPKLDACMDVTCPPNNGRTCSNVRAACVEHVCAIACNPVPVVQSCASGFATDSLGCLVDVCAAPTAECSVDGDCARTRADCCGCARGGSDTAVPKSQIATFDGDLGCTGNEICPDVNTCQLEETPQCAQGTCKLIAGGLPPDACGRPDLPACPMGTTCTVNASNVADLHGVGVCR